MYCTSGIRYELTVMSKSQCWRGDSTECSCIQHCFDTFQFKYLVVVSWLLGVFLCLVVFHVNTVSSKWAGWAWAGLESRCTLWIEKRDWLIRSGLSSCIISMSRGVLFYITVLFPPSLIDSRCFLVHSPLLCFVRTVMWDQPCFEMLKSC